MAKVTLKDGITDYKDPDGTLIFYTRNGQTYVRPNPRHGEGRKQKKTRRPGTKPTRGMIGVITAAWDVLPPAVRESWGMKNVLVTVDGFDYFFKSNKPRLKEGLPMILAGDEEHAIDPPEDRPRPPVNFTARAGLRPGTIICTWGPVPEGAVPVCYTQARGEGIKRGPLTRHETESHTAAGHTVEGQSAEGLENDGHKAERSDFIITGLDPGVWYFVYVFFTAPGSRGRVQPSESAGVLTQAG